jgi:hypothetical protein
MSHRKRWLYMCHKYLDLNMMQVSVPTIPLTRNMDRVLASLFYQVRASWRSPFLLRDVPVALRRTTPHFTHCRSPFRHHSLLPPCRLGSAYIGLLCLTIPCCRRQGWRTLSVAHHHQCSCRASWSIPEYHYHARVPLRFAIPICRI